MDIELSLDERYFWMRERVSKCGRVEPGEIPCLKPGPKQFKCRKCVRTISSPELF